MASDGLFWVPDPRDIWIPGRRQGGDTYLTDFGEVAVKESDRGQEITDQDELRGVDDCCSLTNVSPASILHTLRVRYARGDIYTNVSNVLIATNPFKALSIYSQEYIEQYRSCEDSSSRPPHIFGLCAQAFAGLMETNDLASVSSQAVLISGESGAGKTETTKLVLFFASEMLSGQEGGIEDILMEINPILEAFGNAKTVRNNNSSRFGKWMEVRLDPASRCLEGVQVVDYLLEVTRVTGQGPGERNYHIFYQLAASSLSGVDLKLGDAAKATYLAANPMQIEGVDDEREFQDLRKALTTLEFSVDEEHGIFRAVAGVLHMGNLDFVGAGEASVSTPEALAAAAELLGVDASELSKCVCFKRITTGRDVMMSPLDVVKARLARDSMAKVIYSLLFKWLVLRCNEALGKNVGFGSESGGQFLGVLDIAGFESFERNLLEQLLINLSNEKLQHFFNNVVFTRELEEYQAEDIDIANIVFADNSDVLALIEGPGGLLSMLDDATTGVRQTDELFTQKVLKDKASHGRFLKPNKFNPLVFGIKHYAGDVFYTTTGFLEKNVQTQPPEVLELLAGSSVAVICEIVQEPVDKKGSKESRASVNQRASTGPRKKTVGSAFKKSLAELMEKLKTANCHFVRCIKPNQQKLPDIFESKMAMDQLRLCGVMETVEIRKAGFLVRQRYADFVGRYLIMVPKDNSKIVQECLRSGGNLRGPADDILKLADAEQGQFALGKTKVFLKASAFQILEERRREAFDPIATSIQAAWRGYSTREIMREVKELHEMIMQSIEESGHQLRAEVSKPKVLNRASLVESSLKHFDLLLLQAVNLPVRLGYLHEVSKVRATMAAEAVLARKLANFQLQVNVFEMEEALSQAAHYKIEGSLVDTVRKRLEDARAEGVVKQSLQAALDTDELNDLSAAVQDATGKGYHELKRWMQPSGAATMEKAMARLKELEQENAERNARLEVLAREVESHLTSTDIQAVQEVLARAAAATLDGTDVDRLAERSALLERELTLHRELSASLSSGSLEQLGAAVRSVEGAAPEGENCEWVLPKLIQALEEAKRRIAADEASKSDASSKKNGEAVAGFGASRDHTILGQVKAQLQDPSAAEQLDQLLALQDRLDEHLAGEAAAHVEDGEKINGRLLEERAAQARLTHHIERLKEEIVLIEGLQSAVKDEGTLRSRMDELFSACSEGKWAKGSEYWIRSDGWTVWQHFKDKKERMWKSNIAVMKLKGAIDSYDVEEMEGAYSTCIELGVSQTDLEEYNKVSTQLQRPHTVRDLLTRWRSHNIRCANLTKQLEYLVAKEAGAESMILLQLSRLKNSQSVETMRLHLRKADRGEIREQIVEEIRRRADEIERQEPFVQLLREAAWSRNCHRLEKAIADFEASEDKPLKPDAWKCNDLKQMYFDAMQCLDELRKAQTHLEHHEHDFLCQLEALKASTDIEALEDALDEAAMRKVGGELVCMVKSRCDDLKRQRCLIDAMRKCIYSQQGGSADLVQDLLEQIIAEGLDSDESWVLEDGPRTYAQLRVYVKEVEAESVKKADKDTEIRRELRELVHSTDVQAIKDVLARATIYKVKTELTETLEGRIEMLELQARHLKGLRQCLNEPDAIVLGEAIARVRKEGLDNPSKWVLPEGAKFLSKVIAKKVFCDKLEDIDISIRRACRTYDVIVLQNCFREAEDLGVPSDHFVEAKKLFESLHDGGHVGKLMEELKKQLRLLEQEDPKLTQAIKNLVDQQKQLGLMVDHEALREVSSTIARTRARSRGKSCVDVDDPEDADVARSIFEDLSNLKILRDPMEWDREVMTFEARGRAMVEFQADKIASSLTVCSARQDIIALHNFQDILRCMGDKPCAFTGNKEEPILRRLLLSRRVCDESYVQVMKQLTNNPSQESRFKGWRLLKKMVRTVLPSAEVYEFLHCFVQREAEPEPIRDTAKFAEKKDFRRLLAKAAKKLREESPPPRRGSEEEAEGEGLEECAKQQNLAAIARAAAKKQRDKAVSLTEERPMSCTSSVGGMKTSRSLKVGRRNTRRKSLAAALEEREREEERRVSKKRSEKQVATAQEILDILMRDSQ